MRKYGISRPSASQNDQDSNFAGAFTLKSNSEPYLNALYSISHAEIQVPRHPRENKTWSKHCISDLLLPVLKNSLRKTMLMVRLVRSCK